MIKITKVRFITDPNNADAIVYALQLKDAFQSRGVDLVSDDGKAEFFMVFGGDGTMLRAKEITTTHRKLLFGINFGHRGFMMNEKIEPAAAVDRILHGQFQVHGFPLLEITVGDGDKKWALNDVYFNRITGRTAKFNVKINGVEIAERISGDGVVVCSALGSAGYFVPAGGSVLHPGLPVIGFAPIVRNIPIQIIPMVFPIDSEVEISLLSPKDEVRGWYDGFELPYFEKIKIRSGKRWIKLAFWEDVDFTERLIRKIMKT